MPKDHSNIYSQFKIKDETSQFFDLDKSNEGDEFYKFKKNFSLDKSYETYLNIEKKYTEAESWLSKEPMEDVAKKIKKG